MDSFPSRHANGFQEEFLRLDGGEKPNGPKHEMLRKFLLSELDSGRLKPGEPLPAEMTLVRELGVSRTTVRQALATLQTEGLISRERGRGTYVTDLAARRLRQTTATFALITTDTRVGYYPSLLHGFERACHEMGSQALICSTGNNSYRQCDHILQLLDREVAGVAMIPAEAPATRAYQVNQLKKNGIPVVFCHRSVEGVRAPVLAIPFRTIGRTASDHLQELGHRRIAVLVPNKESVGAARVIAGVRESLEGAGRVLEDRFVREIDALHVESLRTKAEEIREIVKGLLSLPDRPTAIVTSYDPLAEIIYMALAQLGVRMPEDVSLISFGGTWRENPITQTLTSVAIDETQVGNKAATLLGELRSGKRALDNAEVVQLPLLITSGTTVGAVPPVAQSFSFSV